MCDHEFENYLALLSRLLRLDGKQRESIAGELRAHLEDRLDELLAQGVTRNEAVRKALEEFGDAASLAGQLGAIGRKRKRRWLMRVTTFSVAATVLIAAGVTTFWPGRNAGPGVAAVVAQDPKQVQKPAEIPSKAPRRAPTSESTIEKELNETTELSFVETPLKDVMAFLQDRHGFPIVLKVKKLEEAGVQPDVPITKDLKNIPLRSALNLLLEDLELTYLVKDDVLQITTLSDAQAILETRIYDCRDLLDWPAKPPEAGLPGGEGAVAGAGGFGGGGFGAAGPGMPGVFGGGMGIATEHDHRAMQLMSIITTNIEPQSWRISFQNTAGTVNAEAAGAVSEYSGLIVITQTAQTHKKIEHVLDMLRQAAGLEVPQTGKVVR